MNSKSSTTSIKALRQGSKVKEWIVEKADDALLGSGHYGDVWKATHRYGMKVAIKSYSRLAGMVRQDRLLREILREAVAQGKVDHENVVTLIGADEERGCLICELLPTSLEKECKKRLKTDWFTYQDALDIFTNILEGLGAIHKAGIIHGDLKPANILMTEKLSPKISDFGMASILSTKKFPTPFLRGSNRWAAPEVIAGDRPDHQSDLFSIGIIGYLLFTGCHPFYREDFSCLSSPEDCICDHNYVVKSAREINGNIPDVVSYILEKSLQRDREKRYKSVDEILMALSELEAPTTPGIEIGIDVIREIADNIVEAKRLFCTEFSPIAALHVLDELISKYAEERHPYLANAYSYKAYLHNYLKEWDKAIEAASIGILVDPHHSDLYYTRGYAYQKKSIETDNIEGLIQAKEDFNKAKVCGQDYRKRQTAQRYIDQISDLINVSKLAAIIESATGKVIAEADTIIVPAHEEGFKEIFIGEHCWYKISISQSMLDKIKYIACYQTAPISAVTHYAEVAKIEGYKDTDKFILYFKKPAKEIGPIKLVPSTDGGKIKPPYRPRYTTFEKLMIAENLDQLF